jgi:pyruvate carboxylase
MHQPIRSVLIAGRGEIAIRIVRAARELDIRTVAIFSHADRVARHRFAADESHPIGAGRTPTEAYLDVDEIVGVARHTGVDAVHPGYGFLAESPEFADACARASIAFVGPSAEALRTLGNKVATRTLAQAAGVPVLPGTGPLPRDVERVDALAAEVGYPLMIKAAWGGGGRGMRAVESAGELAALVETSRR